MDDELTQCEDAVAAISRDIEGGPMDAKGIATLTALIAKWESDKAEKLSPYQMWWQAMAAATLEENVVLE